MEKRQDNSPLRVYCEGCGAPIGFDIIKQTYVCSYCGQKKGIKEAKTDLDNWTELQKETAKSDSLGQNVAEYSCPSCGAGVVFREGEASETCAFCNSKLIRKDITDPSKLPNLVIPFFITSEEAKERMLEWGKRNSKEPEARSLVSNIKHLKQYYLPYRIVRGPIQAEVSRQGNFRRFECAGFLDGVAVNTSKQLDNLVLNGMEPFDWSEAKTFDYGYIAGLPVKIDDLSDSEIDQRIREEVEDDFRPTINRVLHTKNVGVNVKTGNMSTLNALLPVYFIRKPGLTAAMNGQTGRIAVSKNRKKFSIPWWIEPLIYTIIITILIGIPYNFDPEILFYSGVIFACLFFTIFGEGGISFVNRIIMKSETAKASRDEGVLKIDEEKNILKNPYDNTPIFYEPNRQGEKVPVKISFYSVGRWIYIILNSLITIFLPAILAVGIRFISMNPDESFFDNFRPFYGIAWYTLAGFVVLLYLVKDVRLEVYERPIIQEILPDNKLRMMGKLRDRKLSIFSVFATGKVDENGKQQTLFSKLKALGGLGAFVVILFLIILLGSAFAIAM